MGTTDQLAARVSTAGLEAAGAAIGDDLDADYTVELIHDGPQQRGYRVTDRTSGQVAYFAVDVRPFRQLDSAQGRVFPVISWADDQRPINPQAIRDIFGRVRVYDEDRDRFGWADLVVEWEG